MDDQQPSTSTKDTYPPVTGKKTRKNLKKLLEVIPPIMAGTSSQTSMVNQSMEADKSVTVNNDYLVVPSGCTFFEEAELMDYYDDFKNSAPQSIFISKASDLVDVSLNLKTTPIIRNNYCQYSYVQAPTLAFATNAYGIIVNNSENFSDKTTLYNLAQLEPKHRVTLLLPTSDYWWSKNSSSMFKAFIEQVGTDIKSLAMQEDFKTSMTRFGHNKNVLMDFKCKYLSATRVLGDETVPAVFGVKIFNTNEFNSKIRVPMAQVQDDDTLEVSTGNDLVPPKFMHSLILLTVTGFKITKSGISLDTEVKYLIYRLSKRLERNRDSLFSLQRHIVRSKRRNSESNTSLNDSSFDEYDDSTALLPKKKDEYGI